jgi:V/A-type H+-transporting ATPase subunit I
MLTPEKMGKILIAAPRDLMGPVIAELYRQRLFHIEDFVEDEQQQEYQGFRIGVPLEGASETSRELIRLRSVTSAFSIKPEEMTPGETVRTAKLKERIEKDLPAIEDEVENLLNRRSAIENQVKETEGKIDALSPFAEVPIDLSLLSGYRTVSVLAGFVPRQIELDAPREEYFLASKKANLVIVAVPTEYRPDVERKLLDAQFEALPIPPEKGMAKERLAEYSARLELLQKELGEVSASIDSLKTDYAGFLAACDELLSSDVERAEAPLRFATTDHAFIAEGWVPRDTIGVISERIGTATEGRAFVTELPLDKEKDVIPVEYDNVKFAKPTQLLMDVYSRPKYTEIDPTLSVAIVFPIFFGLILGDVGYGAMVLAFALALQRFVTAEDGRMLLKVLRNAGISSIIFGFLYSEFLGFPIPGIPPLLPSRHLAIGGTAEGGAEAGPAVPELMMMAVWLGILHITLGRIFGIVNHARQDHGKHRILAILANLGWLLVMYGILLAILSVFDLPYMPVLTGFPPVVGGLSIIAIIGLVMVLVGVLFIVRDSALEIVELPTILSHVLSYARIVGVGLSSVAIAGVINLIAIGLIIEPQLEHLTILGVVFIIIGVVVFLIGHLMNAILGMLGGGLQSLRLNYVEFFTKFYKGGGKKYNPFGMKRRFTED